MGFYQRMNTNDAVVDTDVRARIKRWFRLVFQAGVAIIITTVACFTVIFAETPENNAGFSWRYVDAQGQLEKSGERFVSVPEHVKSEGFYVSDHSVVRMVRVSEMAGNTQDAMTEFYGACGDVDCPRYRPHSLAGFNCQTKRHLTANKLRLQVTTLERQIISDVDMGDKRDLFVALGRMRRLADNMDVAAQNHANLCESERGPIHIYGLSSGGVMDNGYFEQFVDDGKVPPKGCFSSNGYFKSFVFAQTREECDETVCITPQIMVDHTKKRLYLAANLQTQESSTQRQRRRNVVFAVDVSSSMDAHDKSSQSRLAWSQQAIRGTLDQLREDDHVAVIAFAKSADMVVESTSPRDRQRIDMALDTMRAHGLTNMEAGLQLAFSVASDNHCQSCESRVILLSDAGTNTGVVDQKMLIKLVGDYAAEGIFLTTIGIGEQLRYDLVKNLVAMKGGNYVFAQSGFALQRYFQRFGDLMSPVAHHLHMNIVSGMQIALRNVYGVPDTAVHGPQHLLRVNTLFATPDLTTPVLFEFQLSSDD